MTKRMLCKRTLALAPGLGFLVQAMAAGIADATPGNAREQIAGAWLIEKPVFALRIGEVNGINGRGEFRLLMDLKDKGLGGSPPPMMTTPATELLKSAKKK